MPSKIKIFVSYSRRDAKNYLNNNSLLGYLKGLEKEDVEFWTDRQIPTGALWDDEIKKQIAASDIALVLVSQGFLDSEYCQNVEIKGFLEQKSHLFPIILSACDWKRHKWLSSRQFLPGGDETIEEHYSRSGKRKRLFHQIRDELHDRVEQIRASSGKSADLPPNPFTQALPIRDPNEFIGRETELRRLQTMLQGASVALQGKPKIGKSSLLWRLAKSWEGEVLGPIDLQGIEDQEDFYERLAESLQVSSTVWRDLRTNLRRRQALLLLDELDSGLEWGMSNKDLGRFRAICHDNPNLKLVAVSRNPLAKIFPDPSRGSNPYDFLVRYTVGEMIEDEARRYLAHPWEPEAPAFDEATIKLILKEAGGYPIKLQRAAFHCYEALSDSSHNWQTIWKRGLENIL